MLISFVSLLISISVTNGSHFNGESIRWSPVNPYHNSSSVIITVTQTYYWNYSKVNCLIDVPMTTVAYNVSNTNLTCVANCSTNGNYTYKNISILTDCISSSSSLDVLTSQRSVNITFPLGTFFWICYQGNSWRSLKNFVGNVASPPWDITALINLQMRPDGFLNTPPMAQITSPQYVIVNVTTTITIPVSDVDINDDLRCRWSLENSSYGVNECGAICTDNSFLPAGTTFSNCTITFMSPESNVWYGFALQVEDFINTTSNVPMSSIPIQFLIYVLSTPNCVEPPQIVPLTVCLQVQVNVSVIFVLYATDFCNTTTSIITDIMPTTFIDGMNISDLMNSTTNSSLVYVTLTWIPQLDQIGSQQFCAIAYTNEQVQSDTYCVTFIVTTSQPCLTTTTTQTASTVSETTTTASETTSTVSESTTSTIYITLITSPTSITSSQSISTNPLTQTTSSVTTVSTVVPTNSIASETKTTEDSNSMDIPLIVGLSLLGLLLSLCCCCCCCWLYHLFWSATARRRRQNQQRKSYEQLNEINKYFRKHQIARDNVSFQNSIVTRLLSINKKKRNNHWIESPAFETNDKNPLPVLSTNVHVIKLSRNQIYPSGNTSQLINQRSTTLIRTSNRNQTSLPRNILIRTSHNDQIKQISHISTSNIKSHIHQSKRPSNLNHITVKRIKTHMKKTISVANHPPN